MVTKVEDETERDDAIFPRSTAAYSTRYSTRTGEHARSSFVVLHCPVLVLYVSPCDRSVQVQTPSALVQMANAVCVYFHLSAFTVLPRGGRALQHIVLLYSGTTMFRNGKQDVAILVIISLGASILCMIHNLGTVEAVAFLNQAEKCSACHALVYELERAMKEETPQPAVKVGRQVLGSDGKKKGRVIDYQYSELRAITLVDGLCPNMKHYGKLEKNGKTKWLRVNGMGEVFIDGTMTIGGQKSESEGHALSMYCYTLLEMNEEAFVNATRQGAEDLDKRLCSDLLKVCDENGDHVERRGTITKKKKKKSKKKISKKEKMHRELKEIRDRRKRITKDVRRLERIVDQKMQEIEILDAQIGRHRNDLRSKRLILQELDVTEEEIKSNLEDWTRSTVPS